METNIRQYGTIVNKSPSIFGVVRPSLLGDVVASLPFLNYLEKIYPESYKLAYIDKKCAQILPFLINHPLIDKIQVSEQPDNISLNDLKLFEFFDIIFNPFPRLTRPDYYNYHHITKELFCMNEIIWKNERINSKEWDKLSEKERQPKLYQWFDIERKNKTIAIWPFSGYSTKQDSLSPNLRSPSKEWWIKLIDMLSDYKIIQFGHPKSEKLNDPRIIDCRQLNLFDAVKISLGCDLSITTDSGVSWILGAYGVNQIVLYTNYLPNHYQNFDAMVAVNWKNNIISLFGENGINNINQEKVIDSIKKFC